MSELAMKKTMIPEHVVIVGCGFTGTTAFHQLVRQYPVRKITIFEQDGVLGPGFPYKSSESREYLINNTNDTMCLDPSNRRAFVEWLATHDEYAAVLDGKGHMPRSVYGEFLADVIGRTSKIAASKGIDVQLLEHECHDIEENADGTATMFFDSGSVTADMVILATGRCPDRDAFGISDAEEDYYFRTHMPGHKLDRIPMDATCHVVGASLSAFDVVNQLFSPATGCEFVADGVNRLRFVANGNNRHCQFNRSLQHFIEFIRGRHKVECFPRSLI
jgi:uncharacterized NAD(P)/FAD-binding protein YdhS